MTRVRRWARLQWHALRVRRLRRELAGATGDDFDRARDDYLDVLMCMDPEHCDHR